MAPTKDLHWLNSISDSAYAQFDEGLDAHLRILHLLDSEAGPATVAVPLEDVELCLQRMLSLRSEISTEFEAARVAAKPTISGSESFTKIGFGTCGSVFSQDDLSLAVKLSRDKALWNDYCMHRLILKHFREMQFENVKIPACFYFVPKSCEGYFASHPKLVEIAKKEFNLPYDALITERIPPLPHAIRMSLIVKYCAPRLIEAAKTDPGNRDCLVRTYLGSFQGKINQRFFSLRNFKIHLNQMAEVQLDVITMARDMGTAMAIMHWAAKTDARDVEFVLGSSSNNMPVRPSDDHGRNLQGPIYTGPASFLHEDLFRRSTELWVLDFNQVRPITLDDAGVELAVEAARINDPYFPKPLQETQIDKDVFNAFAKQYLCAAHAILAGDYSHEILELPRKFIYGLVEIQRQKQQKQ